MLHVARAEVDAKQVVANVGRARALERARAPRAVADGVYQLKVFTEEFCSRLCDELDCFSQSGLPAGRPNSMNNAGVLLDEL